MTLNIIKEKYFLLWNQSLMVVWCSSSQMMVLSCFWNKLERINGRRKESKSVFLSIQEWNSNITIDGKRSDYCLLNHIFCRTQVSLNLLNFFLLVRRNSYYPNESIRKSLVLLFMFFSWHICNVNCLSRQRIRSHYTPRNFYMDRI